MPGSSQSLDYSSHASDVSYNSDDEYRLAQKDWEESLTQLHQLVSMVLMPFLGKWLGRRWSYWAYARYLRVGLGKSFFVGDGQIGKAFAPA